MEGGDSSDAPPTRRAGEAEVDGPRKDDVLLLADEKFDFDLSLSSLSANEDDEVFFGPVGHKERCIAARLERRERSPEAGRARWSPLAGEKFAEVYKEARLLAFQIESSRRSRAARAAGPADAGRQGGERFIQDPELKTSLFERENKREKSPDSLKRETYCLSDSPGSGPQLPGVQPASGVGPQRTAARAPLTRTRGPQLPSRPSLPPEASPVCPPNQPVTQKKAVSKLPPPRASVRGNGVRPAVEKSAKETPASPSRVKTPAQKQSQRDGPPDAPRTALDVTGAPARGGHLDPGKRSLPVPSKTGLKRTALKPPGCAAGLARRPGAPGGLSGGSSGARAPPVASTGGPPDSATPRLSRALRPQSCTSTGRTVHGTPARRASGLGSQTPASVRHAATLLTPAGRRLSGLPVLTPRTQPRTLASPRRGSARRLSSEPRQRSAVRPELGSGRWDKPSDGSVSPPAVPQALSFSPEKGDPASPTSVTAVPAAGEAQPPAETAPAEVLLVDVPLERLRIAPTAQSALPADVALIDFRSPPGACGPLIDLLVNTPDTDRNAGAKLPPNMGLQLVDPCAPLIQLSPEANKENVDSPLLKF